MVRSTLTSMVFVALSSFLLLLLLFVLEMLLKLIEAFVPEPFVLMHPSGDLAKWLRAKGDEDFATLLFCVQ